jgi:hypothetical protein
VWTLDSQYAAGDTVTATLGTEHAGTEVTAMVFSTPQTIGKVTVADDGTVAVQLPADLAAGDHHLAFYDVNGEVVGWTSISVTAAIATDPAAQPADDADQGDDPVASDDSAAPAATPSPTPSETATTADAADDAGQAPLTVIPPADNDEAADGSALAVTGPASATPIVLIVALGVAVGLGLILVARRDRMRDV